MRCMTSDARPGHAFTGPRAPGQHPRTAPGHGGRRTPCQAGSAAASPRTSAAGPTAAGSPTAAGPRRRTVGRARGLVGHGLVRRLGRAGVRRGRGPPARPLDHPQRSPRGGAMRSRRPAANRNPMSGTAPWRVPVHMMCRVGPLRHREHAYGRQEGVSGSQGFARDCGTLQADKLVHPKVGFDQRVCFGRVPQERGLPGFSTPDGRFEWAAKVAPPGGTCPWLLRGAQSQAASGLLAGG
jgi:hypothetical protein